MFFLAIYLYPAVSVLLIDLHVPGGHQIEGWLYASRYYEGGVLENLIQV